MATDWADVERGVLHRALKERVVMATAAATLPGYPFTNKETQWIWDHVYKTWTETAESPSVAMIRASIELLPELRQKPYLAELVEILRTPQEPRPRATMASMAQKAKASAALTAMDSAAAAFDRGDLGGGVTALERGLITKAARVGIKPKPLIPRTFRPIIHQPRIPTGLWKLDKWIGGLQKQEVGLIVGATGVGKSALTTTMGCTGVGYRRRVLHIDTENGEHVSRSRYLSWFTGVPARNIETNSMSRSERETLDGWLDRNHDRLAQYLKVIYLNYMENSIADVEAGIQELIDSGWPPDEILFDSPDHLEIKNMSDVRWEQFAELYNRLKGVAQRRDVALWAVTQAGQDFEDKIATNRAAADSYQKPRVASIMISINMVPKRGKGSRKVRTEEDAAEGGKRCIYLGKNRNGPARFVIPIEAQWKYMRMKSSPECSLYDDVENDDEHDDEDDDEAA